MAAGSKEERASESAADPAESFLAFRKSGLAQFVSAWSGLGQLPFVVLIFFPRLCLSMLVVAAGQLLRAVPRLVRLLVRTVGGVGHPLRDEGVVL